MGIRLQRSVQKRQSNKENEWRVVVVVVVLFGLFLTPLSSWAASPSTNPQQQQQHQHHLSIPSFLTRKSSSSSSSSRYSDINNINNPIVLLLDVDNTLYREEHILQSSPFGIESQIVKNIHDFCAKRLNLTSAQANDLHYRYGSTIEGIRRQEQQQQQSKEEVIGVKNDNMTRLLQDFYHNVYDAVDVSALMYTAKSSAAYYNTGYSSSASSTQLQSWQKEHMLVQKILHSVMSSSTSLSSSSSSTVSSFVQLASNSPKLHVRKVIHALGLTRLFSSESQFWTPDRERRRQVVPMTIPGEQDDNDNNNNPRRLWKKPPQLPVVKSSSCVYYYPTKLTPTVFFDSLLSSSTTSGASHGRHGHHDDKKDHIVLIDDSNTILAAIDNTQLDNNNDNDNNNIMHGIAVTTSQSLLQALCLALHWVDSDFQFIAERYLRCKNVVDVQSLHRATWHTFVMAIVNLVATKVQQIGFIQQEKQQKKSSSSCTSLTVVDVGAGLLSMLGLILGGNNTDNDGRRGTDTSLPSLWQKLEENNLLHQLSRIDYYAYEPNGELEFACTKVLEDLGFDLQEQFYWDAIDHDDKDHNVELVFVRKQAVHQPQITVYLRFWDYERPTRKQQQPSPDVIVGCCFADLVTSPYDLVRSLYRCFLSKPAHDQHQHLTGSAIIFFPITFSGSTQLLPPQPLERISMDDGHSSRVIPSDTTAFSLYARALEEQHGHNLDVTRLEDAMKDYGAELLSRGRSDWVIEPGDDDYLWQTMMYFFGTTACPQLQVEGFDAKAWIHRSRLSRATIRASNVDLLFRAPYIGHWRPDALSSTEAAAAIQREGADSTGYDEIQFTASNTVTTIHKPKDVLRGNQVRVRSVCSLISSGTELKVFKGMFDDAALDVNFENMADQRMAYPLAYGYSLVGRVTECGPEVQDGPSLLGKLVFVFAAHASQVVVDRSALQVVPPGIQAMDAIFMPSVETALSIVHDAHVRVGEHVAVFGQGLIGLLVTALLGKHGMYATATRTRASLTTFDNFPDRLALSAAMGSSQALLPSAVQSVELFDVAIEVSGHPKALQSAIDYTRNGGRIVIASWYGNRKLDLQLGIDFHRSHKRLQTSQVSEIPTELRTTWSKQRRFDLTWDLVREIQPSRRLLTRRAKLHEAQDVYEALDLGREIAVAFEY